MREMIVSVLELASIGFGAIALTMYAARWFWLGELMTPFRPHVLAACAAVAVASSFVYGPLTIIFLATIALLAIPICYRLWRRKKMPAVAKDREHTPSLSIVMSNVLCSSTQFHRVVTLVREQKPDVFVAVEATDDWLYGLMPLRTDYPHVFLPTGLGLFGMAVFSKCPFRPELVRIGKRHIALVRIELDEAVIYAVHPLPPLSPNMGVENRVYLDELARCANLETKPTVLVGDFNSTIWSANLKPFLSSNWQWPHGSGFAYSWPTHNPLLAMQIDLVLARGFRAGSYMTLGNVGSDHFPIRTDLLL